MEKKDMIGKRMDKHHLLVLIETEAKIQKAFEDFHSIGLDPDKFVVFQESEYGSLVDVIADEMEKRTPDYPVSSITVAEVIKRMARSEVTEGEIIFEEIMKVIKVFNEELV